MIPYKTVFDATHLTYEQHKNFQLYLFRLGCKWITGSTRILMGSGMEYYRVNEDGEMTHSSDIIKGEGYNTRKARVPSLLRKDPRRLP